MNKSSIKISKTSMEKYLRINLQGKISINKSSLKFFQKFKLQNKSSRKNLHKQIFTKGKISKEKSPKPYSKGKISMNKSSLKLFQNFNLQNKSSRKNLHEQIFKRKNLQWTNLQKEKSPMNKSSIKISKTSMAKSLRINLQGKISMNKSSKGKIFIFQRKNLQNHIPKEKSPWTDLLKKYSKIQLKNLQNKSSRKHLHKQIFK